MVLLRDIERELNAANKRSHQCLSACCGVVTKKVARSAFELWLSPMPFGLLWCCYDECPEKYSEVRQVTNAFRPVVVLLPTRHYLAVVTNRASPMPFGLLWCCYRRKAYPPQYRRFVTNAFRPVVVLLHTTNGNKHYSTCTVTNAFRPVVVLLRSRFAGSRMVNV